MFAEVVLPIHLNTLTYKIPDGLDCNIRGHIVRVPFHKKEAFGLVVDVGKPTIAKEEFKDIIEDIGTYCDDRFVDFMKWLSHYYLSSLGMALKASSFDYVVEGLIKNYKVLSDDTSYVNKKNIHQGADNRILDTVDELTGILLVRSYKTIVIRPTCKTEEDRLIITLLHRLSESLNDVIVLVPEINDVLRLQAPLKEIFDERLITFHSKMKKAQKVMSAQRVIQNSRNIVLGTRSALLMPFKELSIIIVHSESSISYKAEEGMRYNARDVAVRLGFTYNCPVLLSSISPSVETYFNVMARKYDKHIVMNHQRCKIKPVYHPFAEQMKRGLSKEILSSAQRVVESGGIFAFISPREGYSLIYCKDCGSILRCGHCNQSVIFYKDRGLLICLHCQSQRPVNYNCDNCKGFNLVSIGSGLQRVKDEIEEFMNTTKGLKNQQRQINEYLDSFVIADKSITKTNLDSTIQGSAIIDFDYFTYRYGYKADEIALYEVLNIACLVEQKGYLYLQTNNLKGKLLSVLKNYDFNLFYNYQLELRKNAGYPPYKKLISLLININDLKNSNAVKDIITNLKSDELQILGPIQLDNTQKGGKHSLKYLFKTSKKAVLDTVIRDLEDKVRSVKGIELIVDVDPFFV